MDEIPDDVLFATVEPRTKVLHQVVKWVAITDEEVRRKWRSRAIRMRFVPAAV